MKEKVRRRERDRVPDAHQKKACSNCNDPSRTGGVVSLAAPRPHPCPVSVSPFRTVTPCVFAICVWHVSHGRARRPRLEYSPPHNEQPRARISSPHWIYATTIGRRRIGFEHATVAAIQGGIVLCGFRPLYFTMHPSLVTGLSASPNSRLTAGQTR